MTAVGEAPRTDAPWRERVAGAARDVYRRALLEIAIEDERIVCVDSDMGGLEDTFGAVLPDRYINVGIAEANMMSVGAGLAALGLIPFVNTISSFACCRACEQVKIDVAENNLDVKIVVTHSGVSAGHYGPTHHALEDVAIMRALANMIVVVPADAAEADAAARAVALRPGPAFVRLGRKETPLVHEQPCEFTIGEAIELREGTDATIVASGAYPVLFALEAHETLAREGIRARVLDMHTIKPLDEDALLRAAAETAGVVTVEEHTVVGGLGSAVAELLAERAPTPCRVVRIGFAQALCDAVGTQRELLTHAGITPERVAAAASAVAREIA